VLIECTKYVDEWLFMILNPHPVLPPLKKTVCCILQ